jgi:hypothetical protein
MAIPKSLVPKQPDDLGETLPLGVLSFNEGSLWIGDDERLLGLVE